MGIRRVGSSALTVSSDYRAAVFYKRFLAPAFSEPRPDVFDIRQAVSRLTGYSPGDPRAVSDLNVGPVTMLQFIISIELVEWGMEGCRVGYFPSAFAEEVQRNAWWSDSEGLGQDLAIRLGMSASPKWQPSPYEFGKAMQESLATLHGPERERLRLLYFAAEDEWQGRLSRLRDFATHLETRPAAAFGTALVDNVSWGLLDEPHSGIARTPSRWRFKWARAAYFGSSASFGEVFLRSVRTRLRAFEAVRLRIEAVAPDLEAVSRTPLRVPVNTEAERVDVPVPHEPIERLPDTGEGRTAHVMPMDLYRVGETYVARIDLPGVEGSNIDIDVVEGTLTVRAYRQSNAAEEPYWLSRERTTGPFVRQLVFGSELPFERIEAEYRDGVLTLTIPATDQTEQGVEPQPISAVGYKAIGSEDPY
jgi:HSP20 family molecular chaperone IbpA